MRERERVSETGQTVGPDILSSSAKPERTFNIKNRFILSSTPTSVHVYYKPVVSGHPPLRAPRLPPAYLPFYRRLCFHGRSFFRHASRRIFLSSTRTYTRTHASTRDSPHIHATRSTPPPQKLQSCKRRCRSPIFLWLIGYHETYPPPPTTCYCFVANYKVSRHTTHDIIG